MSDNTRPLTPAKSQTTSEHTDQRINMRAGNALLSAEADIHFEVARWSQAGSVNLVKGCCDPARGDLAERPQAWPGGVLAVRRLPGSGLVLLGAARGAAPAVAGRDALGFRPRPDVAAALTS